jgi:hypothetical protein
LLNLGNCGFVKIFLAEKHEFLDSFTKCLNKYLKVENPKFMKKIVWTYKDFIGQKNPVFKARNNQVLIRILSAEKSSSIEKFGEIFTSKIFYIITTILTCKHFLTTKISQIIFLPTKKNFSILFFPTKNLFNSFFPTKKSFQFFFSHKKIFSILFFPTKN